MKKNSFSIILLIFAAILCKNCHSTHSSPDKNKNRENLSSEKRKIEIGGTVHGKRRKCEKQLEGPSLVVKIEKLSSVENPEFAFLYEKDLSKNKGKNVVGEVKNVFENRFKIAIYPFGQKKDGFRLECLIHGKLDNPNSEDCFRFEHLPAEWFNGIMDLGHADAEILAELRIELLKTGQVILRRFLLPKINENSREYLVQISLFPVEHKWHFHWPQDHQNGTQNLWDFKFRYAQELRHFAAKQIRQAFENLKELKTENLDTFEEEQTFFDFVWLQYNVEEFRLNLLFEYANAEQFAEQFEKIKQLLRGYAVDIFAKQLLYLQIRQNISQTQALRKLLQIDIGLMELTIGIIYGEFDKLEKELDIQRQTFHGEEAEPDEVASNPIGHYHFGEYKMVKFSAEFVPIDVKIVDKNSQFPMDFDLNLNRGLNDQMDEGPSQKKSKS